MRVAQVNVERAGLTGLVHIERRYLADCRSEHVDHAGLVVVNPPYGERLGEESELPGLYRVLGEVLKRCYEGWRAAVFTGNPDLGKVMGLRAHKMHVLYNGAIECKLLHFEVQPQQFVTDRRPAEQLPAQAPAVLTPGAEMFANRLRKNLKQLGKWAEREKSAAIDYTMPTCRSTHWPSICTRARRAGRMCRSMRRRRVSTRQGE